MLPLVSPSDWTFIEWVQLGERELLLFALFWFILGMVDEIAVDAIWLVLRATGHARTPICAEPRAGAPLAGPAAVLIPAWQEAAVIATTISHMVQAWPQPQCRFYVGCYGNDPATLGAAMGAAGLDPRVRLVINDHPGPTTKADCLNRLYAALAMDEARSGMRFRAVVLQDAEDMVHPQGLGLIDQTLTDADFVQLPVRPAIPAQGAWIAGHYADEFTESHAKALVVRDWLGAALPAAGVGCGFARGMLEAVGAARRAQGMSGPFAADCLTEDYELGLLIARAGGRSRFVRQRDTSGRLIGTSSYFPATLMASVRQKARWIHGISLQGWDRLGWDLRPVEIWMALRDRRGPLTALVLLAAYVLLVLELVTGLAHGMGVHPRGLYSPQLQLLMRVSLVGLGWRAAMRGAFTAREYGPAEGVRAVLRIPVANVITIMAGWRALRAYLRTLRGGRLKWEKTEHRLHPAAAWAWQGGRA